MGVEGVKSTGLYYHNHEKINYYYEKVHLSNDSIGISDNSMDDDVVSDDDRLKLELY